MKKLKLLTLVMINLCLSITTALSQTNIALTATVTTSYCSSWETLSAVNNNSNPTSSNDKSTGAYGNWNHPNTLDWVQYDWTSSYTISKTEVYWFDDGGGVLTPTTAYVEYWNGSAWVNCGTVPKVKNTWNVLNISNISTSRFRISMLNTTQSTGILEWRVWGVSSCAASAVTPYVQINGGSWAQSATASLAVGGSVKFGPQPISGGSWSWSGPNNFTATTREVTISNIQTSQAGTYIATYTNSCGAKTTQNFTVTVTGGTSDTQAPTTPGTPTSSNITSSSCTLTWTASTDNVGVTGYQVLRNGTSVMTVTGTTASVTGLSASTTYSFTIKAYDAAGNYSSASGAVSVTTSAGGTGTPYTWPAYSPTISYNFVNEYGNVATPTNVLGDCSGVAGTQSSEWWCFRWGSNKNSLVTSAAITPMLSRLNTDFAYFRNTMGWPPDLRALKGYRSAVYLYGSGLCTDNASNTDLGGWQSAVSYNGTSWPIILASYYPVYSFDPACTYSDKVGQQGAMVHEGIHCVLASLPGCKDAAWFHEGGNTWLQQEADSRRSNTYSSMGFLNAAAMIAPFMPIECYSGWLQDGSFGGPAAEGVNMFNGSQQICTWKNLLGGTQYGNIFPTFLGQALGNGAVPWIWRYATSRVLQGMSSTLGDAQTRRLICEYRAKQAVVDFGVWTNAIIALLDANMGVTIQEEWSPYNINSDPWTATPYVATTNNSGTLTPAAWTTPGWSGANQIPLTVSGSSVTVNFQPIGANMTCQLCYIATDGSRVYSQIVSSGNCTLNLTKAPANNVVIAVICNTDYVYNGETTRKAHYDYRLQLGTGVTGTANINSKWYKGANALKSATVTTPANSFDISQYCSHGYYAKILGGSSNMKHIQPEKMDVRMYPNPVSVKGELYIDLNTSGDNASLEITDLQGKPVFRSKISTDGRLTVPCSSSLKQGLYLVTLRKANQKETIKLVVK